MGLTYPSKKIADRQIQIFYPINKQVGKRIEEEVINIYEKVTDDDRYNNN
jgi:DNA-binding cell septation regulator SpoVG